MKVFILLLITLSLIGFGVSESNDDCEHCQMAVKQFMELKDLGMPLDYLAKLGKEICSASKGWSSLICKTVLGNSALQTLELLRTTHDPLQVCRKKKLCSKKIPTPKIKTGSTDVCKACKDVINDIIRDLHGNISTATVKKVLDQQVCGLLGGSYKDLCVNLVNSNAHMIVDFIHNELNADALCKDLQLCVQGWTKTDMIQSLMQRYFKMGKTVDQGSQSTDACKTCMNVVADLEKDLIGNVNASDLENMLDTLVCTSVPPPYDVTCKDLAHTYAPNILEIIKSELNSKTVCAAIQLCPSDRRVKKHVKRVIKKIKSMVKKLKKPLKGEECEICKNVIGEAKKLASNPQNDKVVADYIKKELCCRIGHYADECGKYVEEYLPMYMAILASQVDPQSICQGLGACTNTKHNGRVFRFPILFRGAPVVGRQKSSPTCLICEFVMREINRMILNNKSEEVIKEALDRVCNIMPTTVSKDCNNFVKNYEALLIKMIKMYDTSAVCVALKLCFTETMTVVSKENQPEEHKGVKGTTGCELCKTAVAVLRMKISSNATKAEVKEALDKVCQTLPTDYREMCIYTVKKYESVLLALLQKDISPEYVCQKVQLCGGKLKGRPMLGSDPCTWGPHYICSNINMALRCGTISVCKKMYWKKQQN